MALFLPQKASTHVPKDSRPSDAGFIDEATTDVGACLVLGDLGDAFPPVAGRDY